jgi:hypothetical protein
MRLAEVFLRLGLALVAWLLLAAHMLWLAVLGRLECGTETTELYLVLLGMTPLTLAAGFGIRASRALPEIHALLKWLAVPLLLLLPLALSTVWAALGSATLGSEPLCGIAPRQGRHVAWAPVQLALMVLLAVVLIALFRPARKPRLS